MDEMNRMVIAHEEDADAGTAAPRARVGMIIPSVNRMSEPQFNRYAPAGLGIHVARGRIAGPVKVGPEDLDGEIERAALTLKDCGPDLIVFHCTATAMSEGRAGEARILALIKEATGIAPASTSELVVEALRAVGMRSLVVLSPYADNNDIIPYLGAQGFTVVHDKALGCPSAAAFEEVTPQQWLELAVEHDRPEADGIFLSCTNTRQIEAIGMIERALGKPVVNSNQAVLWGCVKRLRAALGEAAPAPELGRLMQRLDG
jgi:maleate cis-trans isomerase